MIRYIKERNLIKDTFYSKAFKAVLIKYLKLEVDKDWLGRLYGIINPNINIDGKFDINNTVIELDDNNTNDIEYVKVWAHKQLRLISDLFKIHKLYNYISLDFKKVGPENADNYLLVFDISSRKEFANSFKKMMLQILFYSIVAGIILFFIL